MGASVCKHINYLGLHVGSLTSDDAFSLPLSEAQHRASLVSSLQLSLKERIILEKFGFFSLVH